MDEQHVSLPRCDRWIGVVVGVSSVGVHIYENTCTHMSFPDIFILKNLSFASIGITSKYLRALYS